MAGTASIACAAASSTGLQNSSHGIADLHGRQVCSTPPGASQSSGIDDPLLKRVARLNAVAKAVSDLDLLSIAKSYSKELGDCNGCSGAAATAATNTALTAILQSAMCGNGDGADAAERELRNLGKRQARESRGAAWRESCAAEAGSAGEEKREHARQAIEERQARAIEWRDKRLAEGAANRRVEREERLATASARKTIKEAKERLGVLSSARKVRSASASVSQSRDGGPCGNRSTGEDPALLKARVLCDGAARLVSQLEAEDSFLNSKLVSVDSSPRAKALSAHQQASPRKAAVGLVVAAPTASKLGGQQRRPCSRGSNCTPRRRLDMADEAELVARAKELLVDYKPIHATPSSSSASQPRVASSARSATVALREPASAAGTVPVVIGAGSVDVNTPRR